MNAKLKEDRERIFKLTTEYIEALQALPHVRREPQHYEDLKYLFPWVVTDLDRELGEVPL